MSVKDFLDEATRFVNLKYFYLDLEKIPKPKVSFYVASTWSLLGLALGRTVRLGCKEASKIML